MTMREIIQKEAKDIINSFEDLFDGEEYAGHKLNKQKQAAIITTRKISLTIDKDRYFSLERYLAAKEFWKEVEQEILNYKSDGE